MSRKVSDRHVLSAVLQAESPLHIGAATAGFNTDMELIRDGRGRLLIPGTSLAGALRAALRRFDPATADDPWWGDAENNEQNHGGAARISVEDAPQIGGTVDGTRVRDDVAVRDGVALDRANASARDHLLFSREVIYPGARFQLHIGIDAAPDESDRGRRLLDSITDLLTRSGIDVGAAASRGLGRVRIHPVEDKEPNPHRRWVEHRNNAAGMLDLLSGGPVKEQVTAPTTPDPDPGTLLIKISWEPNSAVMSMQAIASAAVDTMPAVSVDPSRSDRLRLLLAGTGLAGAFSSRVERIARTLAAGSEGFGSDPDELDRERLPGLRGLFGSPGRGREDRGIASAVGFADCLGKALFDRRGWEDRVEGDRNDQHLGTTAVDQKQKDLVLTALAMGVHGVSVSTHNGIDRWTGGASDGLLFSVGEPKRGTLWDPIRIRVDVGLLERDPEAGATGWALLLLGLKALTDGSVPLGGLVTRGLGSILTDPGKVTFSAGRDLPAGGIAAALAAKKTLNAALNDSAITDQLNLAIARDYPKKAVTAA